VFSANFPSIFLPSTRDRTALMGDRERAITTIAVTYDAREAAYVKCIYFVSAIRSAGNLQSILRTEFAKFTIAYPLDASRGGFRDGIYGRAARLNNTTTRRIYKTGRGVIAALILWQRSPGGKSRRRKGALLTVSAHARAHGRISKRKVILRFE